ncbi:hypothetical protein ADUPG1_000260 [Aduncisulcus paluster]|uniref:Uncharacterized protein n=1 Tax=Aduncisulcus paluster TaxID=2918883 RepID=A0ABQ5K9N2_9EUKA|nr:hypothetical protein ADUPG1_000260 [Aduncisulcus paluster]
MHPSELPCEKSCEKDLEIEQFDEQHEGVDHLQQSSSRKINSQGRKIIKRNRPAPAFKTSPSNTHKSVPISNVVQSSRPIEFPASNGLSDASYLSMVTAPSKRQASVDHCDPREVESMPCKGSKSATESHETSGMFVEYPEDRQYEEEEEEEEEQEEEEEEEEEEEHGEGNIEEQEEQEEQEELEQEEEQEEEEEEEGDTRVDVGYDEARDHMGSTASQSSMVALLSYLQEYIRVCISFQVKKIHNQHYIDRGKYREAMAVISRLKCDIDQLAQYKEHSLKQMRTIRHEREEMVRKVGDFEKKTAQWVSKQEQWKKEKKDLKQIKDDHDHLVKEFNKSEHSLKVHKEMLQDSEKRLQKGTDKLKEEKKKHQQQKKKLDQLVSDLKRKSTALQRTVTVLEKKQGEMEMDTEAAKTRASKYQSQLNDERLARMEAEKVSKRYERAAQRCLMVEEELELVKVQEKKDEEKRIAIENDLQKFKEEMAEKDSKIEEMTASLAKLQEKVDSLSSEVEEERAKVHATDVKLRNEKSGIKLLKRKEGDLVKEIKAVRKKLAQKEKEIESQNAKIEDLEKEVQNGKKRSILVTKPMLKPVPSLITHSLGAPALTSSSSGSVLGTSSSLGSAPALSSTQLPSPFSNFIPAQSITSSSHLPLASTAPMTASSVGVQDSVKLQAPDIAPLAQDLSTSAQTGKLRSTQPASLFAGPVFDIPLPSGVGQPPADVSSQPVSTGSIPTPSSPSFSQATPFEFSSFSFTGLGQNPPQMGTETSSLPSFLTDDWFKSEK